MTLLRSPPASPAPQTPQTTVAKLVTSDAHFGLVAAIGATLPGATWQRYRTHYAANLMSTCPKASWPWVETMLHSVYDQPDTDAVNTQFDRLLDAVADKLPAVADDLETARPDVLAFASFPEEVRRQIGSSNPNERLNREIRRVTIEDHAETVPHHARGHDPAVSGVRRSG